MQIIERIDFAEFREEKNTFKQEAKYVYGETLVKTRNFRESCFQHPKQI